MKLANSLGQKRLCPLSTISVQFLQQLRERHIFPGGDFLFTAGDRFELSRLWIDYRGASCIGSSDKVTGRLAYRLGPGELVRFAYAPVCRRVPRWPCLQLTP